MDFVTSYSGKMNLLPVEHFFNVLSSLLDGFAGCNSKPTQKWWQICWKKVFNWSEVHLYEMNCYKIHTLVKSWQRIREGSHKIGPFFISSLFDNTVYTTLFPSFGIYRWSQTSDATLIPQKHCPYVHMIHTVFP